MVLLWFRHYFIKQILNLMGLRSDRPANILKKMQWVYAEQDH